MDKMVKKEIKSALSFAKQTVKFVFFLAHLLFQTKGNFRRSFGGLVHLSFHYIREIDVQLPRR